MRRVRVTDIALVHIGNGLVNGNESMVAEAFAKMWATVVYAASEQGQAATRPLPLCDGYG